MASLLFSIRSFSFFFIVLGLFLFALGCGDSGNRADPGAESSFFSAPLPARFPQYLLSSLTVEVRVDEGGPIPLTVDDVNRRVRGTITGLVPGAHTVEIFFYLNGVIVATGSTTATVVAGQVTQVSFDPILYPDGDGDGWVNLAELEWGTAWNDASIRPPAEIPRSSQDYVLSDLVGILPVIGASISPAYSEQVGIPSLVGEKATSPNYTFHGH